MIIGEFSYMLLVLNCGCKHVLKYDGCGLLKSYEYMFCCCRVIGPHTVVVGFHIHVGGEYFCIQLFRVIIQGDYDVQLASRATASEVIWYHTCLETV